MQTRKISHIVSFGDSLTDRGTMDKRTLFGIPLRYVTGLAKDSPQGRFTNGYTWNDDFGAILASMLLAKEYEKRTPAVTVSAAAAAAAAAPTTIQRAISAADLADDIIDDDFTIISQVHSAYSLDDDKIIQYKGSDFLRSYAEGGLTAHDYSNELLNSEIATRLIVSTLDAKRKELLTDDAKRNTSQAEKDQTLVTELSGANDLITVNKRPSKEIVDKAVAARVNNINELIKMGYKHFAIMGLPDISRTPRFQALSADEQNNARVCVNYFNEQMMLKCQELQKANSNTSIDFFDLAPTFNTIIDNPEKYGLDKDKLKQPYIDSPDFKSNNGVSPAPGYTFWDDVHPTAHVHAIIANEFYAKFSKIYDFNTPNTCVVNTAQALCETFMTAYLKKLKSDQQSMFGSFRTSKLQDKLKTICIENERDYLQEIMVILYHALKEDGVRTRSVLIELGWIDSKLNINDFIPALAEAKRRLCFDIDTSTSTHSLRYG